MIIAISLLFDDFDAIRGLRWVLKCLEAFSAMEGGLTMSIGPCCSDFRHASGASGHNLCQAAVCATRTGYGTGSAKICTMTRVFVRQGTEAFQDFILALKCRSAKDRERKKNVEARVSAGFSAGAEARDP